MVGIIIQEISKEFGRGKPPFGGYSHECKQFYPRGYSTSSAALPSSPRPLF